MSLIWQYLLIFVLVAIEGPAVTIAAAVLAGTGVLNPLVVALMAGAGNICGDLVWYALGYVGYFERVMRWFPKLAGIEPQIARLKAITAKNATRMLLIAKLSLGIASIPTLVAAGMTRVSWQRVVSIQLLGEIIWTGGLVLFGLFLGQYVSQFQRGLQIATVAGNILLLLGLLWVVRKQISRSTQADYLQIGNR